MRKNPGSSKEKQEQLEALKEYRREQAALAILRDNGYCVRCYWFPGHIKAYEHVHHTEGRGTYEKEHYTKLICLCAECHNLFSAMRVKEKSIHREQRELIKIANKHPINLKFNQDFDEQD